MSIDENRRFDAKHKKIRENVVALVREHPSTISDYRKLLQYYWYYKDGLKVFIPLETIEKLSQPESVCRAFRKLIEQKVIVIDPATKLARISEEKQFRRHYGRGYRSGEDNFTM